MALSFSALVPSPLPIRGRERPTPGPANRALDHHEAATLAWLVAANLVAFLCVTHLGVLACFALAARVPNWLAPAALLLAVGLGDLLARHERLPVRGRVAAAATVRNPCIVGQPACIGGNPQ